MNSEEVAKVVTYIEENLRASTSAGLRFVDSRHSRSRLVSRQNHVVFGRRGAGKTSLVNSTRGSDGHIDIYLNLEDYKDITFPNVVIYVLVELFKLLDSRIRSNVRFWRFRPRVRSVRKQIRGVVSGLESYVYEPDSETQQIDTTEEYSRQVNIAAKVPNLDGEGGASKNSSRQVSRSLPREKIEYLRLGLTRYKNLIVTVSQSFENKPVFLVMDDLYFVAKDTQPELIDYFHRLTKGTNLFLKVATIKHRSKIYRRASDQYIGVELGHDIFEIDMDYTLDSFEELQGFMRQLLKNARDQAESSVPVEDMFAGDGFAQLCLHRVECHAISCLCS